MSTVPARPAVQPPAPWSFPASTRRVLGNGIPVDVFHLPGQKITSTRINVPAPLAAEPREIEGVATIVSRTMDEGTRRHSADEMAERFERAGVGLHAGVGTHGLWMDLDATARQAPVAWDLGLECLAEPAFPEQEVNRHRQHRLSQHDHDLADPGYRALLEFVRTFFSPQSRVSRPSGGTRETLAGLTRDHCVDFHRRWVRPDDAFVVVAGDIDVDAAVDGLDRTLGGWAVDLPRHSAPESPQDAAADDRARVVFVDRPGAVQTQIHLGWVGPVRERGAQWAPYPALSYALSGTPHARVDKVLREDKGFTYGIRGAFRPRQDVGQFVCSGAVRADSTAESLRLLTEIFDGAADGFTEQELRESVDFLSRTAPGRYATADQVADEAAALAFSGLDTGFVTDYLAALLELTVDDLDAAWRRWLTTERTIVLVGDASAHAAAVDALGLGDLTVV